MKNVPAHYHPEVQIAMRMASTLAAAGLVHPLSDQVGEMDIIDWASVFYSMCGVAPMPAPGHYTESLEAFAYNKASFMGWVTREERLTSTDSPPDILFKQQLAAVQAIQKIPAYVPRSSANQALVELVVKELQQRALLALRAGVKGDLEGLSFAEDGRFEKLKMFGVTVASCGAGERDPDQWIVALESNLGIHVPADAQHQVLVEIDGREFSGTSVRVKVFSDRLSAEDESRQSLCMNFTHEGVITDCLDEEGEVVATESSMYEDVVEMLGGAETAAAREAP